MYARVATFEGDDSWVRQLAERIGQESGPPEGVPGKEFFLLAGRDGRKLLAMVSSSRARTTCARVTRH
jgi:hypothetical protein